MNEAVQQPVVEGLPQPGRPLVIGVVNVTPDSFSDGGRWYDPDDAIAHGLRLWTEGADVLDVGGESTRPGAERPTAIEERRRVLAVVTELVAQGAVLSVDTMRAEVASAAVEAGAVLVNDVSGGLADPDMLQTVAQAGVAYVAMHWRGHAADMQRRAVYADLTAEVVAELGTQIDRARIAGIAADRLVIDPGIGFAKTAEHNWELLANLDRVLGLGQPVLVGASRKEFLGRLLAGPDGVARAAADRDHASAAVTALLAGRGIWAVRTHTVAEHLDAIVVARRLAGEKRLSGSDKVVAEEAPR